MGLKKKKKKKKKKIIFLFKKIPLQHYFHFLLKLHINYVLLKVNVSKNAAY